MDNGAEQNLKYWYKIRLDYSHNLVTEVVQLLVVNGADQNLENHCNQTVLDLTCWCCENHDKMITSLSQEHPPSRKHLISHLKLFFHCIIPKPKI